MDASKDKIDIINANTSDKKSEKYALRPRSAIKRQKQEQYQPEFIPKRPRRIKPRSTSISKYRRKTANARERHRMQVINTAFESLRKVLPEGIELCTSSSTSTKISTLRQAVNYIRGLSDMLEDDGDSTESKSSNGHPSVSDQKKNTPAEPSSTLHYNHPQTVLPVTNKNLLRCPRTSSLQYLQPSSYYFSSAQAHFSVPASKNFVASPSARGSLSSTSDLEELLSDDSEFLEDNFDVFHDISSMTSTDPFEVLLEAEKNCSAFTNHEWYYNFF